MGQSGGVLAVLILRGILSPFAHPLFTSMTGIGCGLAATSRSPAARVLYVLVGYGFAVLAARTLERLGDGGRRRRVPRRLPLHHGAAVPRDGRARRLAAPSRAATVAAQLPGFAMAGWIAPSEVALLSTLAGRNRWRRAVRQRSGKEAAKAVTEYQTAVTELAFLRARMSRGAVGPHAWELHNERLAVLAAARARAMGQPEALTAAWLRPPPSGWTPTPRPGWRPPSPPPGWAGRGGPWGRRRRPGWGPPPPLTAASHPGRRTSASRSGREGVERDECRPARPARRRRGLRRPGRRGHGRRAGRRRAPRRRRLRRLPGIGHRAEALLPGVPLVPPDEAAAGADLVLLAVPDDVLAGLVRGLAAAGCFRPGQIVVHTSGAQGVAVLDPAAVARRAAARPAPGDDLHRPAPRTSRGWPVRASR